MWPALRPHLRAPPASRPAACSSTSPSLPAARPAVRPDRRFRHRRLSCIWQRSRSLRVQRQGRDRGGATPRARRRAPHALGARAPGAAQRPPRPARAHHQRLLPPPDRRTLRRARQAMCPPSPQPSPSSWRAPPCAPPTAHMDRPTLCSAIGPAWPSASWPQWPTSCSAPSPLDASDFRPIAGSLNLRNLRNLRIMTGSDGLLVES